MRLEDVSVRYRRGAPWVLRGISASLNAGDLVVLTGRNGSGKSTLLRVIAGLLPVASGSITDRPDRVAWAPEAFPSGQPFTMREFLSFTLAVRSDSSAPGIESLAERLYVEEFLDTQISELSKGTIRKLALMQALLPRPALLVLDEPWDGLDAETQAEVPALMKEITAEDGICVVTDHHGNSASLTEARRWHLARGELVEGESLEGDR